MKKNIYFDLDKLYTMLSTSTIFKHIAYVVKSNYKYADKDKDLIYILRDTLNSKNEFGFLHLELSSDREKIKIIHDDNTTIEGYANATEHVADIVYGKTLLTHTFNGEEFKKLYFHGTIFREEGFIVIADEFKDETIMIKPLVATVTEIVKPVDIEGSYFE